MAVVADGEWCDASAGHWSVTTRPGWWCRISCRGCQGKECGGPACESLECCVEPGECGEGYCGDGMTLKDDPPKSCSGMTWGIGWARLLLFSQSFTF